jgi:hypothetical protein
MTKLIVAIATLALFAGYAVAQLALTPVASYEPERSTRTANIYSFQDGDTTCYVLDNRRGSAISCVK